MKVSTSILYLIFGSLLVGNLDHAIISLLHRLPQSIGEFLYITWVIIGIILTGILLKFTLNICFRKHGKTVVYAALQRTVTLTVLIGIIGVSLIFAGSHLIF